MLVSSAMADRARRRARPRTTAATFPGCRSPEQVRRVPDRRGEAPAGNLANTTMETYAQGLPASCMGCHHAVANARGYDFVGVFGSAPPRN